MLFIMYDLCAQAQLPSVGEDLLRSIEVFAVAVGDVTASTNNLTRSIENENLSKFSQTKCYTCM